MVSYIKVLNKLSRKKLYAITIVIVLLISSFVALYWSGNLGQSSSPDDIPQNTVTVVDSLGRSVTLNVPVARVALMDTELINAFAAIAGEDFMSRIVGLSTDFQADRPDLFEVYKQHYPELEDIASMGALYDGTFSVEAVVSLNPDVLILPQWGKAYDMIPDLSALDTAGIPYVYVDVFLDPYGEGVFSKSISLLGTLLGQPERADELIDFYELQINAVFDVLETVDDAVPVPSVYNEAPNADPRTYGETYLRTGPACTIEYARGVNIAEGTIASIGTISGEFLIDANPDIIVLWLYPTMGSSAGGSLTGFGTAPSEEELQTIVSAYLARDGWSSLDAVKNGRVHFCNSVLYFSLEKFAVLQYMAQWSYPELFPDLDPWQNLQDAYTEFMPFPIDGTWTFSSGDVLG
jgi:iron complex transport system substrate-binding protein